MTNKIRPIDANALALKISEYMVGFPKRSEQMFTCMHILSMLEDENQTQTLAGFVPDYNVEPTARIDREKWEAEWVKYDGYTECSKCEYWYNSSENEDEEDRPAFCPSCGRAMTQGAMEVLESRFNG